MATEGGGRRGRATKKDFFAASLNVHIVSRVHIVPLRD